MQSIQGNIKTFFLLFLQQKQFNHNITPRDIQSNYNRKLHKLRSYHINNKLRDQNNFKACKILTNLKLMLLMSLCQKNTKLIVTVKLPQKIRISHVGKR